MIVIDLIYNLSLLVAVSVLAGFIDQRFPRRTHAGAVLQGILFGGVALLGMLNPFVIREGLIFDGRSVVLSLCALFFGPLSGAIAGMMAAAYRISIGGGGMIMGVSVILSATLIGIGYHQSRKHRPRPVTSRMLLELGIFVHIVMIPLMAALPSGMRISTLQIVGLTVIIIYPLATLLIGKILKDQEENAQLIRTLSESEGRFKLLFEEAPLGYQALDTAGRILTINKAWNDTLGHSRKNVIGRSFADFLTPESAEHFHLLLEKIKSSNRIHSALEVSNEEGELREIAFDARVSAGSDGQKQIHCIITDITEQRQAETRLFESNQSLEKAIVELQAAQKQLVQQERLAAVGQLSAGIAHDFNNILAAILGHAEMIRYLPSDEQQVVLGSDVIIQSASKAAQLVQQILDFSRKSIVRTKIIDLVPLIYKSAAFLSRTISENIKIKTLSKCEEAPVLIDPAQMEQVITNLVLNARDAMPEGGIITLDISCKTFTEKNELYKLQPGNYAILKVIDTGSGIAAEALPHVFEPFFTTKELGKGSGLGLAQVYGIIKRQKGQVHIDSKAGSGTTVCIYLPLKAKSEDKLTVQEEEMPSTEKGGRILLVEDDKTVLQTLSLQLQSLEYDVISASNSDEAIEIYNKAEKAFHILISDLMMPGKTGLQLAKILKKHQPELKILIITGYPVRTDTKESEYAIADIVLEKPVTMKVLKTSLALLLTNRSGQIRQVKSGKSTIRS
ncbi:MAG TPA: PAS domain S-box protein [Candidatus Marinimicrobia bacterium]|nr:PAS domain S-box protein [Candidatus Neomarinimicrobiota bacterium]